MPWTKLLTPRILVGDWKRRSDGTITVAGIRYEIPSAYRMLVRPTVRVARWDLSSLDLVDPRRGTLPHRGRPAILAAATRDDRGPPSPRRSRALRYGWRAVQLHTGHRLFQWPDASVEECLAHEREIVRHGPHRMSFTQ